MVHLVADGAGKKSLAAKLAQRSLAVGKAHRNARRTAATEIAVSPACSHQPSAMSAAVSTR